MSDLSPNPFPEPTTPDERALRREERRLERENQRHGIFWPLFLIAAGVIFLLYNLGIITGVGWSFILSLWPVLLIVGGLDGLWKGEGIAGSLFWLGIGVLFLGVNLGYLPGSVWNFIWRLWPVLLVVIGLDIIIGRRAGIWAQALSVVVALALLAGLFWYVTTQPSLRAGTALPAETFSEPLQGATSATVDISLPAGQLSVTGGAEAANLVQGRAIQENGDPPEKSLVVQNGAATYTLRAEQVRFNFGDSNGHDWDLELNNSVPTDLQLNLGAGENLVDLTGMNITALDVNMGAGQTTLTLPAEGQFSGEINGAVGELVLRVPRGLPVEIQVNRVITGLDFDEGFTRIGDRITSGANPRARLSMSIPVGSIRLETVP